MNESNITEMEPEELIHHRNFLLHTRFWVQRILVPSIMTIGIVGNVITVVIMTRRRMRSSTHNYLAALAIFDMLYLVLTFVLSLSHYPRVPDSDAYWRLRPLTLMLTDTCSNTSVWLTVTFTVERYIAVCHPMKGKVLCTESRAKKAISAVFLCCFAFTIPTPFEWEVVERVDETTNRTTISLDHSDLGRNYLYRTIYYWLTVVLFIFVPFILLAIFNSFLIRSVRLSRVQRSAMTRGEDSSSQESKITVMLIAVVILFFVCQLPTACHLLYTALHEDLDARQLYLLRGLGNIFNFLMSVNSAGNFVLYCLLSQKYRRTFVQIFCPCLFEKRNAAMNSVYYQSTVCSNVDTDSPGSGRRLSNRLDSSRKNSSPGSERLFSNRLYSTNLGPDSPGSGRHVSSRLGSLKEDSPDLDSDSPVSGKRLSSRLCSSRKSSMDSPGHHINRLDSSRESSTDLNYSSPAGTSRTVFLQVPQHSSSKVVYDDDDSLAGDPIPGRSACGRCKRMVARSWRHWKESMGCVEEKTREQIIPLKGGGNKCIVITAPDGIPDTSQWTSNSAV